MTPRSSNHIILHRYRHLYRHLLRAIQYSTPARYVARDILRQTFRKGQPTDYQDESSIMRTLEFLRGATETNGMEHRIVKNLLHVGYWEDFDRKRKDWYVLFCLYDDLYMIYLLGQHEGMLLCTVLHTHSNSFFS